jgi:hypothetical protein
VHDVHREIKENLATAKLAEPRPGTLPPLEARIGAVEVSTAGTGSPKGSNAGWLMVAFVFAEPCRRE